MTADYFQGDKIVSLKPFRSRALFAPLGVVEGYWEGLRNGRLMPARAEVDPRGIAEALEYAFVLEKIAPGLARFRLAGLHLNELLAMEVRGMPISAMFLPEARRELKTVLEAVLDTPAAVRLTLSGDPGFGRARLEGQMVLLPLRDEQGAPSRILGALQTRGEIGRGPRRFSIRDIETRPLPGDPLSMARRPTARFAHWNDTPAPAAAPKPALSARARDLARRIKTFNSEAETADKAGPRLRLVYDADRA